MLAGAKLTISNFSANLSLRDNSKSTSSRFTLQVDKIFRAKAAITVIVGRRLPLRIRLGLDIHPVKIRKTTALHEKPSIDATIIYSASATGEGIGGDNTCLKGFSFKIGREDSNFNAVWSPPRINAGLTQLRMTSARISSALHESISANLLSHSRDTSSLGQELTDQTKCRN